MRQRGFESHPVIRSVRRTSFFDNPTRILRSGSDRPGLSLTAGFFPAMTERLVPARPPDRSSTHDVAEAYRLAMAEVRVQLPLGVLVLTQIAVKNEQECGVAQRSGGSLFTRHRQVRVLPPQLKDTGALGRSAEASAFQAGEAGSIPAGHS